MFLWTLNKKNHDQNYCYCTCSSGRICVQNFYNALKKSLRFETHLTKNKHHDF